ncbi:MAG: hypothetical protein R2757_22535 [Draconibacterium sp.]
MKLTILKQILFALLLVFTTAGCQEDEIIDEHYPFKLHYAIQNEHGQEVTQIKEGEKFFIYFSIENTSDRHASINKHHLFFNNELFNIYNKNSYTVVGTPVERTICLNIMGCEGEPHVKNEINVPYPLKNDTTIGFMCCSYNLAKFPNLSAGKYLIKYTANIPYFYITDDHQVESHETDSYNLKYEFEIVR